MKYLALKLMISILLIVAIVLSGRWGLANVHYFSVQNQLERLQQKIVLNDSVSLTSLKTNTYQMLQLHSNHPHYQFTAGAVYEWIATLDIAESKSSRNFVDYALQHYRYSLNQRKRWANTWARIVELNAHIGNFDSEFETAVILADRYGPYSVEAGRVLVYVLLNHWREMTTVEINLAVKHLINMLDDGQFRNIYQYAVSIHQESFFCNLVEINKKVGRQC